MTSSETRTDSRRTKRTKQTNRADDRGTSEPSSAAFRDREPTSEEGDSEVSMRIVQLGFTILLLGGWLGIMQINRWYLEPPVFFLAAGWLAVLLTARFLWNAGMAAAEDDDRILEEEFWRPEGAKDELQREKRSLLKAIKEIEFDHQMGKTTERDAKELTYFYRNRAIQIIKTLERGNDGGEQTISDKIDREFKARMAVAHASARGKAQAKASKPAKADASAAASKPAIVTSTDEQSSEVTKPATVDQPVQSTLGDDQPELEKAGVGS